jgi:peptidyl-dipeptidase A
MTATPAAATTFIDRVTAVVRPLHRDIAVAHWAAALSGRAEDFERSATIEKQLVEVFSNAADYAEADRLRGALAADADPLVARQIDRLWRDFRSCQGDRALLNEIVDLESVLAREFNTHRAEFRGERLPNNDLEELLLRTRDGAEAREAWEALKQAGAVAAPRVVDLVRLRNRHAQGLGSANYYVFSLELNELREDRLFALLDDLARATDPLFASYKAELDARLAGEFGIAADALRPWHYRNQFFQDPPAREGANLDTIFADQDLEALTRRFYDGIGIDVRDMMARSDLYEKEGKDQHAFCMGVEVPTDVRVLCNIRPTARWMSTMLHEFGHAAYDRYVAPELPFLLRDAAHTLTTEAVAMLSERLMRRAEFLEKIAGVEHERAKELEAGQREQLRSRMLVFTRWVLVMTHFERGLYEDPERDLNGLWWHQVERFQGLDGASRKACPDWAAKTHLALAPVYYQNYLLGEMTASQFLGAMVREARKAGGPAIGQVSLVDNPVVGKFLVEQVFRHGATLPWNARLEAATGEALNPACFLADLKE